MTRFVFMSTLPNGHVTWNVMKRWQNFMEGTTNLSYNSSSNPSPSLTLSLT